MNRVKFGRVGGISLLLQLFFALTVFWEAGAQAGGLIDHTGDGVVVYAALGDSLTYGVGDGVLPGEYGNIPPRTDGSGGYPARLASLLGIVVENLGVPGMLLTEGIINDLPATANSSADIVALFGGSNDAVFQVAAGRVHRDLQRGVNVVTALGKQPLLFTLPPPCCDRYGLSLFTSLYSTVVRRVAALNSVPVVDLEELWRRVCPGIDCPLYNLPEGLHPNSVGYDGIAQTVAAALLGIDLFAPGGAEELAQALGINLSQIVLLYGSDEMGEI